MNPVYIVMGVSGCGKTMIGKQLALELQIPFYDADDFHPQENIDKMAKGIPLEDIDRWPWLEILSQELSKWEQYKGAVLACSALKESYRELLFSKSAFAKAKQHLIYLKADYETIKSRLERREHHFFNPRLLQSQFDTLEAPAYGIQVDAMMMANEIVNSILNAVKETN